MHIFEALILLHYTLKVVNHSIKDKIYMLKRPTERMANNTGGGQILKHPSTSNLTILNYTVNNKI